MPAKPPIQIYKPSLRDYKIIRAKAAQSKQIGKDRYELSLQSAATGQWYTLTLSGPIIADDSPRPVDGAELRERFSGDCALLSVFLDRNTVEFWSQTGFLVALHCRSCELECPAEISLATSPKVGPPSPA